MKAIHINRLTEIKVFHFNLHLAFILIAKTNTCLAKGIMIKLTLINLRHFCWSFCSNV